MTENENVNSILTLSDAEGNEVRFEYLDLVELDGREYIVLLPDDEDADEVVILEVKPIEGEEDMESYESVADEATLMAVFEIFKERFKDVLNFA